MFVTARRRTAATLAATLTLAAGLCGVATSSAEAFQLRQVEMLRGTNAVCTLDMPDGAYHYIYQGRFDRSEGTLRKMSSTVTLRHTAAEWGEMKSHVPVSSNGYMERIYSATGSSYSTTIRIDDIKMDGRALNSRMVLSAGGREVSQNVMRPFSLSRAETASFEFGPETRAMFNVPFTLSFYDSRGTRYYYLSFKPDPQFEAERGQALVVRADAEFEGKPAASGQLPKSCHIERS